MTFTLEETREDPTCMFILPNNTPRTMAFMGHFSDLGAVTSALWERRCNRPASKAQPFFPFQFCTITELQVLLGGQRKSGQCGSCRLECVSGSSQSWVAAWQPEGSELSKWCWISWMSILPGYALHSNWPSSALLP